MNFIVVTDPLERLWSYLRRFSKMTKDMCPSHRVDVLTDSLLYYSKLASDNLSESYLTVCVVQLLSLFQITCCLRDINKHCVLQLIPRKLLTSSPGQKCLVFNFFKLNFPTVSFTENHIQIWLYDEQSLISEQQSLF